MKFFSYGPLSCNIILLLSFFGQVRSEGIRFLLSQSGVSEESTKDVRSPQTGCLHPPHLLPDPASEYHLYHLSPGFIQLVY